MRAIVAVLFLALVQPSAALAQAGHAAERSPTMLRLALDWITVAIEAGGVAIIVAGALVASGRFLYRGAGPVGFEGAYHTYRAELGRAILLGLEFLVAADIIGTVALDPTFESLGILAGIVAIRTFLSFSLEVEIEGRWPWQARPGPATPHARS